MNVYIRARKQVGNRLSFNVRATSRRSTIRSVHWGLRNARSVHPANTITRTRKLSPTRILASEKPRMKAFRSIDCVPNMAPTASNPSSVVRASNAWTLAMRRVCPSPGRSLSIELLTGPRTLACATSPHNAAVQFDQSRRANGPCPHAICRCLRIRPGAISPTEIAGSHRGHRHSGSAVDRSRAAMRRSNWPVFHVPRLSPSGLDPSTPMRRAPWAPHPHSIGVHAR